MNTTEIHHRFVVGDIVQGSWESERAKIVGVQSTCYTAPAYLCRWAYDGGPFDSATEPYPIEQMDRLYNVLPDRYETVVTRDHVVHTKHTVGDVVGNLHKSTIQRIDVYPHAELNGVTYPERIGEPVYVYDQGGFDFANIIDNKESN